MINEAEKITVKAKINATVEKVWNYWSEPDHITQWNAASTDWHTPFAENDLRTGGKFKSRMESKDGSMGFDFAGEYSSVISYKMIRYFLGNGRTVEIHFSAEDDKTHISETFDPEKEHSPEMQKAGWQFILDNFKKYVEEN